MILASTPPPQTVCSAGLKKLLLRLNLAAKDVIEAYELKRGSMKVLALLERDELIDEDLVIPQIAADIGVDVVDLKNKQTLAALTASRVYERIELELAYRYRCLPVRDLGNRLEVVFADPLDMEAQSALEFVLGAPIKPCMARERDIVAAINRLLVGAQYESSQSEHGNHEGGRSSALEVEVGSPNEAGDDERQGSESQPVIRLVNKLLADGVASGASDIHIEPASGSLEVRFRIDGVMSSQFSIPKNIQGYVITRLKLLATMDITERRRPQDGRFRMRLADDLLVDVRASAVPTPFGEKLVLRLLSGQPDQLQLSSLGVPEGMLERYLRLLRSRDRLVIVTGPTGSGKSTSLYTSLVTVKGEASNIITVEDPIEYRIAGITQIQVDEKIGMTFASALRSILRQDPDIILIGEIRDKETAEIAFQAAQTGHLVLSTLHTNTAASAVTRLLDLGLEPYLIAPSLGGILAQRLVRRVCERCGKEASKELQQDFEERFGLPGAQLKHGKGCTQCDGTGLKGRLGIYSLIEVTDSIKEIIRRGGGEKEIEAAASSAGMVDLYESGIRLVEHGATTLEEVERVLGNIPQKRYAQAPKGIIPAVEFTADSVDDLLNSFVSAAEEYSAVGVSESSQDLSLDASKSIQALALKANATTKGESDRAKRILLVDDDEGVRAVMSRALKKERYEVTEAKDGLDALQKLGEFSPDVIVCDLVMPRLDGFGLVEKLRADSATQHVPILMLTGSDSEENEINLLKSGANDFVSKGSSPALVLARVKRLLA